MAIFNKPIKYNKGQILEHYRKTDSTLLLVLKYFYGIVRFICIIIENLYCVPSYLVLSWIVLLPISWIKSDLYSRLENYLYNSLLFIVSSWSLAAGATVVESGDEFKYLIEEPEKHYPGEETLKSNRQRQVDNASVNGLIHITKTHSIVRNNTYDAAITRASTPNLFKEETTVSKPETRLNGSTTTMNGKTCNRENGCSELQDLALNGHISQGNSFAAYGDTDGHQDGTIDEDKFSCIEYQIESTSTAGERKLIHRSFKTEFNAENNNTFESATINDDRFRKKHLPESSISNGHQTSSIAKRKASQSKHHIPLTSTLSATLSTSTLKSMQTKPRILFLCNHISTADVPLIMQAFSTLTNQSLLWVLDAQFKPTNFGVVCSSHGDFFVAKNSFVDGCLREQVLKHPDRNLLVLFPEGGFLRKRIEGSNRYATRNGYPLTKYVTHPRFGAFKDLIDPSVGVTHIVDATLMYEDIENPLSIIDIALGTRREPAIINYKLYRRSEINPTEEWLRNIWLEKDKLLARYYEDRGSFLQRIENTMRTAKLDWFKVLAVHLFYLLVCYLTIFRLFNATSITMLKARELYYSNM